MSSFEFHGVSLPYLEHPYNSTRLNERAVEIPIALWWLYEWADPEVALSSGWTGWQAPGRTLEIGNVLAHYVHEANHRVVDRYEEGEWIENMDVFDIRARYDRILAISTLEHVRWDEAPKDPLAGLRAAEHLRSRLTRGGRMLVTIPTGYHETWDAAIATGTTGAERACTLSRVPGEPLTWTQDAEPRVRPYGVKSMWADTIWIGEYGA